MTSGFKEGLQVRRYSGLGVPRQQKKKKKSGDYSGEGTPVPISNTAVKLPSADDTWRAAAWESRSLPVFLKDRLHSQSVFLASA